MFFPFWNTTSVWAISYPKEILENQDGYLYLDSKHATLTAKAHRPAYGTDGDYFSKPSAEDIFEKVYAMMHEENPMKFKSLY